MGMLGRLSGLADLGNVTTVLTTGRAVAAAPKAKIEGQSCQKGRASGISWGEGCEGSRSGKYKAIFPVNKTTEPRKYSSGRRVGLSARLFTFSFKKYP